ncbi:unnamed protein product [Onchocerca flexuosa]|uniref:Ovule protein n=1 Tax=Onchocerca flexuosa TaxID=387005 RepID=A0A183I8N5_9BILA|nr:unnamed protein product [Onchocerca flexuosa]
MVGVTQMKDAGDQSSSSKDDGKKDEDSARYVHFFEIYFSIIQLTIGNVEYLILYECFVYKFFKKK